MKKLLFATLFMFTALFFAACDDAAVGDPCDIAYETRCEGNTLMYCGNFFSIDDMFSGEWKAEACKSGTYCITYRSKSDCYKRCTASEVNQRDPHNENAICTYVHNNEYYYIY